MEQLQLDDFLMYNFLSQVQISPDGKKVAYVATTPDLAKNGYNANLYRIDAECLSDELRAREGLLLAGRGNAAVYRAGRSG